MSAGDASPIERQCRYCAQCMTLIRRTQRFGGLSDLCIFECPACDITVVEQCESTLHAGEIYRKRAKACQDLATQAHGDDRAFWLGLSDYWLRLAQVDDEQRR
jgi:hypothetical protein